jgi:hypothetical protein
MPSGGSRPGAGRKPGPILSIPQQVWIGSECRSEYEKLASAFRRGQLDEYARKHEALAEIRRHQAELQEIPVERRKSRNNLRRDDLREDIAFAREELGEAGKLPFVLRSFRPYGDRTEVMKRVAERATEKYGRPVSVRMVRSSWEWFCRLERSLQPPNSDDAPSEIEPKV